MDESSSLKVCVCHAQVLFLDSETLRCTDASATGEGPESRYAGELRRQSKERDVPQLVPHLPLGLNATGIGSWETGGAVASRPPAVPRRGSAAAMAAAAAPRRSRTRPKGRQR